MWSYIGLPIISLLLHKICTIERVSRNKWSSVRNWEDDTHEKKTGKKNSQEWSDEEIVDKLKTWSNISKFKKSKLHIDKDTHNAARHTHNAGRYKYRK